MNSSKITRGAFAGTTLALAAVGIRAVHAAGAFEMLPPMNSGRSGHTATLLPDGSVFIAGGMIRNHAFLTSCERFDLHTKSFVPTAASLRSGKVGHSAALLRDGRVLLAGGYSNAGLSATIEIYDPVKDLMIAAGSLGDARGDFCAVALPDGNVLCAGGDGEGGSILSSVERYDARSGRVSKVGVMSVPRWAFTATALRDGHVLFTGGGTGEHRVSETAELLDPDRGTFAPLPSMSTRRYKHSAVLLKDGRVLVACGSNGDDFGGILASLELYDPETRRFTPVGGAGLPRFKHVNGMSLLPDGNVLLAAGNEQAQLYEHATQRFRRVGSVGFQRYFATATTLRDGSVLIAGGYGSAREDSKNSALLYR
jgi:Galactose oxidase, central domain